MIKTQLNSLAVVSSRLCHSEDKSETHFYASSGFSLADTNNDETGDKGSRTSLLCVCCDAPHSKQLFICRAAGGHGGKRLRLFITVKN